MMQPFLPPQIPTIQEIPSLYQKIEDYKTDESLAKGKEQKLKLKLEIEETKHKLKSALDKFKIEEKTYKITGRIFDEQTSAPLEGVEVKLIGGRIEGDNKTSKNGKFKIKVILPTQNSIPLIRTELIYLKSNFVPGKQSMSNKDKTIKTDLNSKNLLNIEVAADRAKDVVLLEMDKGIEKASKIFLSIPEQLILLRSKGINKFTNVVKFRLLPLAIQIFILFGITRIQDIDLKNCPSPEILKAAIRKRNSIVKQLNQIYKTLIINSAIAGLTLYISYQLKGIKAQVDSLPIPQAVGAPPAFAFGMPYALTGQLQNLSEILERFSEDGKKLNKQMLIALIFLVVALVIILIYLKKIDGMIEGCVQNIDASDIEMESLSKELISLRDENDEGENEDIKNPPITNLNGFTFSIVEDKNQVGSINRRYAVAKNSQGVILLKGEPSFSSNERVLIDELIFYIRQNDLKAY